MNIIKLVTGLCFLPAVLLTTCEPGKKTEKPETKPRIFTPETGPEPVITEKPVEEQEPVSITKPARKSEKPDLKELDKLTPIQEAKRALTTDAFKATKMSLPEFGSYMQSRIPYYRNKGALHFENDVVRIEIDEKEMRIRTMKGTLTYPMQ